MRVISVVNAFPATVTLKEERLIELQEDGKKDWTHFQ